MSRKIFEANLKLMGQITNEHVESEQKSHVQLGMARDQPERARPQPCRKKAVHIEL